MQETNASTEALDRSPEDGKHELRDYADEWSAAVGSLGIQATYAIIAANWAVHSNAGTLLSNPYATISVGVCILFLMLALLITEWITEWLRHRWQKAEDQSTWWVEQWGKRSTSKWPFTEELETLAQWLRYLKVGAPIVAGIFFILSLILK